MRLGFPFRPFCAAKRTVPISPRRSGAIVTLGENVQDPATLQAMTEGPFTAESPQEKNAENGREQTRAPLSAHL
jgi:hypothetical protein